MSRAATATPNRRPRPKPRAKASAGQPIEYSLLLTATLCLVAFGVVMVFSASSTESLQNAGDSAQFLKRTLIFGAFGLLALRLLSLNGVKVLGTLTPILMLISIALLIAVLMPGIGHEVNGARRWIGTGIVQIQPSELAKLALVLHGARLLAIRPQMTRSIGDMGPMLGAVALICLLVVVQPDLGTAMVSVFAAGAMLLAAGARPRDLALLCVLIAGAVVLAALVEPYRMERVTAFLHPNADPLGAGHQALQAKIAIGSGGIFGVGLGGGIQKAAYLPEAHTDMIAAVIGEELGLIGLTGLVGLFLLLGYAGLRTAQAARDRYTKLLAAGLVSLVLIQAVINIFAVMGLAPLTGVPLPLVSYGGSSLVTMLAAVGLLLNIARGATAPAAIRVSDGRDARLRVVDGGRRGEARRTPARARSARSDATSRHSRGRYGGARGAGAGGRRRASGGRR